MQIEKRAHSSSKVLLKAIGSAALSATLTAGSVSAGGGVEQNAQNTKSINTCIGEMTVDFLTNELRTANYPGPYDNPNEMVFAFNRAACSVPTPIPETPKVAELTTNVVCSDKPAYGMVDIGLHGQLYIQARGLTNIQTRETGGTWLYIGKSYSASGLLFEARGFRVVGYSSDPNSFTANLDGFVNSIRGQDLTADGKVEPITFKPGDKINVMLRRGLYTEGLPFTEFLIGHDVTIECPSRPTGPAALPKSAIKPEYVQWANRRSIKNFPNGKPY